MMLDETVQDVALEFADYLDAFLDSGCKNPDDMVASLKRLPDAKCSSLDDVISMIAVAQMLNENTTGNDAVQQVLRASNHVLALAIEELKKGRWTNGE